MNLARHFQADRSVLALILSNLVTIGYAVIERWDVSQVMLIYWAQSVVIGIFNWRRILDLKQFSTKGFRINDRPVQPTRSTQLFTAWFFAFHYGLFHFVYFLFLYGRKRSLSGISAAGTVVCILAFFANHLFSYFHNKKRDASRIPNIGTIMSLPYARIIPMHLTILSGSFLADGSGGALLLFLGLKTVADVIMHMVEHADARRRQSVAGGFAPPPASYSR